MGDMVIIAYRPKPGADLALLDLVREHVPLLRGLGLATARPALVMQGRDGVIVEVFEWAEGAIATAHERPEIQALWAKYAAVSEFIPLQNLPEAQQMFAQFVPIEL